MSRSPPKTQEYVLGLQSLPSAEEYEKLKEQRQKELLREIEAQRQKELEAKRLAAKMDEVSEIERWLFTTEISTANIGEGRGGKGPWFPVHKLNSGHRAVSAIYSSFTLQSEDPKRPTELSVGNQQAAKEGWLPTQVRADDDEADPLVQQISIIKGYITQAKQAGKMDEVKMLTENLKDLQLVVKKEREERRMREEAERKKEAERRKDEERRSEEVAGRKEEANINGEGRAGEEEEDYPDTLNPFAEDV